MMSSKSSSGSSCQAGRNPPSPMTGTAAHRIQSTGDRNQESATAQTGFAGRAQAAAANNTGKK
ncbi:hypothetical protein BVRB_019570 [Beta vulgaris subsp. vulgaris]|uniref:SMP domain-containing protein n=1 Tax=Beta vulgaris subsp. vulgaris TaxID=3555 RepID=A0A0J7YLM0_BETVV|nr:hypothetical protein BVRB_019570 [Beta vulgaris subsp. vulgaris]